MKNFIISAAAALVLILPLTANAEKLPENAQYQELEGASVKIGRIPYSDTAYITDMDGNILSGPYDSLSDYSDFPYAQNNDGSQILFDKDGQIICSVQFGDSIDPPANGIYAIERDVDPETGNQGITAFEIYDYETRELLCSLDRFIFYYLERQTDKMVIEGDNDKFAFINKYGELQSDYVYDKVVQRFNPDYEPFPHSYAIVEQDGVTKYIDWDLNEIDLSNHNGEPFITNCYRPYDETGEQSEKYYVLESGGMTGLYDRESGDYIIPLQTEYYLKYSTIDGVKIITSKNGKAGIIDFSQNILVPFEYESLYHSNDRQLINFTKYTNQTEDGVYTDGEYGFIDPDTYKVVFSNNKTQSYSFADDGIIILYYTDFSDGYRRDCSEIVNFAGHNLTGEVYTRAEYKDGVFLTTFMPSQWGDTPTDVPRDFDVVNVNGKYTDFDGVIRNDRTLVPMRDIIEALGGTVDWDEENRTVDCVIDGTEIHLEIDSDIMTVNGENVKIDVPAQIINDKTMLPVRAVAESADLTVDWDGDIRCVYITK